MDSAYEILGLPLSLELSPEQIDEAWRGRAKQLHPDSDGEPDSDSGNSTAILNEARQSLLDPALRLESWLKARGQESKPTQSLDEETMSLFTTIGESLHAADEAIRKHHEATTALGKALIAKETVQAQLSIQTKMGEIREKIDAAIGQFPEMEKIPENGDHSPVFPVLAKLRFLKKWETECQKRLLELIAI